MLLLPSFRVIDSQSILGTTDFEEFYFDVARGSLSKVRVTTSHPENSDIVTNTVTEKFYFHSDNIIVGKRIPTGSQLKITGESMFGSITRSKCYKLFFFVIGSEIYKYFLGKSHISMKVGPLSFLHI